MELYDKYHEVVNVSILERNQDDIYKSVIIYKAESPNQVLTVNPPVGSVSECHCSAIGKCLLAFNKDVDLAVYEKHPLASHTIYTITTIEGLEAELKRTRECGYAIDREELEIGLTCIGAPILDSSGEAVAAISLSGPSSRILAGNLEERIAAVCQIAKKISTNF
jgi:DNA-binding IclR family transcriptional regulator